MEKPMISNDIIVTEYEAKYINVYDMQYAPGKHYYNATRRKRENLVVLKSEEEYRNMVADAVSCVVIAEIPGEEPRLLLSWEFRYPTNHYVLGVPAGLIDAADLKTEDPVVSAAIREISEETGMKVSAEDISLVNPALFSTPGMTDESNAIVCVKIHPENLKELSRDGAEESECFEGFELLNRAEAKKLLTDGVDRYGHFYSTYTWIALAWFLLQ